MPAIDLQITNPGAEDGTNGWIDGVGQIDTRSADPAPYEGSAYFFGGTSAASEAHQDVPLPSEAHEAIDAGDAEITLEWWANAYAGQSDAAGFIYQYLDGSDTLMGSETSLGLYSPEEWEKKSHTFAVPANARSIRLTMRMERLAGGTNNDGYIDAISAQISYPDPPPTEQETFESSFEDASGRDPLPTALLERTPARNLANHNVIVYKYPPYLIDKRLPVPLEDYPLTEPGEMMWHQDAMDPLFFMGRWAQIERRRFTDNPHEVDFTLRISDHPESFEAPQ